MKVTKLTKAVEHPFGAVWTIIFESGGWTFSRSLWPVSYGKPTQWKVEQLLSSIETFYGLEGVLHQMRENPEWVMGD